MKKPSEFAKKHPFGSVFQKTEYEVIAKNIMTILGRTGDTFRELPWEEYKTERQRDKQFTDREEGYFDSVIEYCESAKTARLFSKSWKD
jgi:hypothetical protein